MKKKLVLLLFSIFSLCFLCSCGSKTTLDKHSDYKSSMENFFESLVTLDSEINALDPEDPDSVSELFVYLEQLEEQYKYFSEIPVPNDFKATESLADEAYDYIVQANQYFKASFTDSSYNEYTYAAGLECYKRANKRVQYVISIIHGELPEGEEISVE